MTERYKYIKCEKCGSIYYKSESFQCDGCGRYGDRKDFLIEVVKHTDAWGNDSYESYTYLHFCNFKCLANFPDDKFEDETWVFNIEMSGNLFKDLMTIIKQ